MPAALQMCEVEEIEEEQEHYRSLILDYDDLHELCLDRLLSPSERHEMDELYSFLYDAEMALWEGAAPSIIQIIQDNSTQYFPMLRYSLGVLDSNEQKEERK